MKKKIFLSGKITGDPEYKEKFQYFEDKLKRDGIVVISPAVLPQGLSNADYAKICISMIDCCDEVLFLPDWTDSPGARVEHAYCVYTGKDFRYLQERRVTYF